MKFLTSGYMRIVFTVLTMDKGLLKKPSANNSIKTSSAFIYLGDYISDMSSSEISESIEALKECQTITNDFIYSEKSMSTYTCLALELANYDNVTVIGVNNFDFSKLDFKLLSFVSKNTCVTFENVNIDDETGLPYINDMELLALSFRVKELRINEDLVALEKPKIPLQLNNKKGVYNMFVSIDFDNNKILCNGKMLDDEKIFYLSNDFTKYLTLINNDWATHSSTSMKTTKEAYKNHPESMNLKVIINTTDCLTNVSDKTVTLTRDNLYNFIITIPEHYQPYFFDKSLAFVLKDTDNS